MEEMILAGRITVNREPADVGQRSARATRCGSTASSSGSASRSRALASSCTTSKAGEIVTRDDPEGRPTVFENLPEHRSWQMDRDRSPRLQYRRPPAVHQFGRACEQDDASALRGRARVRGARDGPPHDRAAAIAATGINARRRSCQSQKLTDGGGEGSNHWYHVVLNEGRNREVRRLFEALGLTVSRLIRTRYGTVAMPSRVKRGQVLELTPEEVGAVLSAAGMRAAGPSQQRQGQGARPHGSGPRGQGKGPRGPGQGQRDRGASGPPREASPSAELAAGDEGEPGPDVIDL